ncbi:MAG: heparinase II/III family protein [Hyphomicrobiales bacterium]
MGKIFNRSPSSQTSLSKTKRDLALGFKRSPLLRWRYGKKNVEQLLLVPRDLRTADPSLSIELDMGQFGLAGATVFLNGGSPLHATPPNINWEKELHGFGWVRNLRAARTDRAQEQAQEITHEWLSLFSSQKGIAWEPEVAARRLISWLSHSNFLLYEADEKSYLSLMSAIDEHMKFLSMTGIQAKPGMPRLLSLISLMFAGLCVSEQEKFADQHVKLMCNELDKQILSDGGHVSRDNSVLASILIDLLPLKQCFVTRNLTPPQPLIDAINRMLPMIHYMRLGDGLMSRFNGAGTTLPDTLSTAMAYDDAANEPLKEAQASKYFRLQKGNVILLMDGGTPPELDLSAKSHAGCLSFEMSSGSCPVIVNCGAAPPAYHTMASNARASVAHSTVTINNRSSAQFIHDKTVKQSEHPSLLAGPASVKAFYESDAEKSKIIGSHDGYLDRFGLIHHRMLSLSHDGYSFIGEDWIEVAATEAKEDHQMGWPFAVHFHIHPDVITTRAADGKSITLTLPDSQEWKFSAQGQIIYLEESIFYADFAGPCQSVQAVVRGNCINNTKISWLLAKVVKTHSTKEPKVPEWISENVIPLDRQEDEGAPVSEPEISEKPKKAPPPPPAKDEPTRITDLVEDIDELDEDMGDDESSLMARLPHYDLPEDVKKETARADKKTVTKKPGKKKTPVGNPPPPPHISDAKKPSSASTLQSSSALSDRIASMREQNKEDLKSSIVTKKQTSPETEKRAKDKILSEKDKGLDGVDVSEDKPLPVKKLPPKKSPVNMGETKEDTRKSSKTPKKQGLSSKKTETSSKKTGPWAYPGDELGPDDEE